MDIDVAYLAEELKQIHEYSRMVLQVFVGWFTFFITVLMTAMAWALNIAFDRRGRVHQLLPYYAILSLFATQITLGMVAGWLVWVDLRDGDVRVAEINGYLAAASSVKGLTKDDPRVIVKSARLDNPRPKVFPWAMVLMGVTLFFNLIFWITIAMILTRRKRLQGAKSSQRSTGKATLSSSDGT